VSQRQDAEVERDAELRTAPAARAGHVYTGVLYDALGYQSLLPAVRRRADQSVWVMSALFGVVRLGDPIPAYRLSADVTLPRLGRVGTWWRPRLHTTLDEAVGGRALLDLRSGSYGAMWAPSGDISDRMAVGRVLQRLPDGSTKVVSHHNKATKGRLVRALLQRPVRARSPEAIADAVESCGFSTRYEPPAAGRPARIDIVVELP
jgi:cytoplasmic iron level regulating protein YaaA (DUF328/UPF0246 family)